MLANVFEVEHNAQGAVLRQNTGATLLMDFKAAFPSLHHRYMHRVLEALAIPTHLRNMIFMF